MYTKLIFFLPFNLFCHNFIHHITYLFPNLSKLIYTL